MISFTKWMADLKRWRTDLKQPNHSPSKKKKIRLGFAVFALGFSACFGLGLFLSGYTLLPIMFSAFAMFGITLSSSLLVLTNAKNEFAQWLDDQINPPRPIVIPLPQPNVDKANELADVILNLNRAKFNDDLDIKDIKNNLKTLFGLRSYQQLTEEEYAEKLNSFKLDFEKFQEKIEQESDWKKKSNIAELRILAIDAVILSDALMAKIEQDIRSVNNQVTTNQVADTLTCAGKPYAESFLYSALIGIYHFARGNAHYKNSLVIRSNRSTETIPEFYQENSIQNDVRKIYNTFITHGFDRRYGGKAFRQRLSEAVDNSIELSTKKDSKQIQKFNALPIRAQ